MRMVEWLRWQPVKAAWFHVPTGEFRRKATAGRLKAMGTKAGIADLLFILPGGKLAAIEIKKPGGRQSPAQKDWQAEIESLGVPYSIVHDIEELADQLRKLGAL